MQEELINLWWPRNQSIKQPFVNIETYWYKRRRESSHASVKVTRTQTHVYIKSEKKEKQENESTGTYQGDKPFGEFHF